MAMRYQRSTFPVDMFAERFFLFSQWSCISAGELGHVTVFEGDLVAIPFSLTSADSPTSPHHHVLIDRWSVRT